MKMFSHWVPGSSIGNMYSVAWCVRVGTTSSNIWWPQSTTKCESSLFNPRIPQKQPRNNNIPMTSRKLQEHSGTCYNFVSSHKDTSWEVLGVQGPCILASLHQVLPMVMNFLGVLDVGISKAVLVSTPSYRALSMLGLVICWVLVKIHSPHIIPHGLQIRNIISDFLPLIKQRRLNLFVCQYIFTTRRFPVIKFFLMKFP
jgi:hypothetical protein